VSPGAGPRVPLPILGTLLLRPREEALAALTAVGWRPWKEPRGLDAERRRTLNLDLSEPDLLLPGDGAPRAVARVETDRDGLVVLLEVTTAEPGDPAGVAIALLGLAGEPRVRGDAAAREWVWGAEAGGDLRIAEEPVRLWISAEQSYGDRLWIMASVVRRPSDEPTGEE
jgi:hypothetical protein